MFFGSKVVIVNLAVAILRASLFLFLSLSLAFFVPLLLILLYFSPFHHRWIKDNCIESCHARSFAMMIHQMNVGLWLKMRFDSHTQDTPSYKSFKAEQHERKREREKTHHIISAAFFSIHFNWHHTHTHNWDVQFGYWAHLMKNVSVMQMISLMKINWLFD